MCGIAGILRVRRAGVPASPIPEEWLGVLDRAIVHRGPDGEGVFRDRAVRAAGETVDVALVHRRLSIIDLEGGAQPMVSGRGPGWPERVRSGRVAVVFNGCIYNHDGLRRELAAAGHTFATGHSDTEVLVHGWRQWGVGLFPRLEGMFAAAVWDAREGALVLARDLCGEKPLYVLRASDEDDRWVAFCSSARGLLDLVGRGFGGLEVGRAEGVERWLRFGFAPGGLLGCEAVPPAGVATFDGAEVRTFDTAPQALARHPAEAGALTPERVERLLGAAVEERLEADVPLGCFLSGGVDSSLVALLAKRRLGTLRTFTVRMPDPEFDESRFAAGVASAIGTRHQSLECEAKPAEDLVRLVGQLGLPFGDSSLLPAYWVSRAARRHVKVALGGDGGDELFGGYDRYAAARWLRPRASIVRGALGGASRLAGALSVGGGAKSRRVRAARALEAATGGGYLDLVSIFPTAMLRGLLGREPAREAQEPVGTGAAMAWDIANYLPDDLLRKTDAASMAVALEVRSPFLDPALINACRGAPLEVLMPGGQRKGLLRAVARRHLPSGIVDRAKMGFAIPLGRWFREDFGGMRRVLMDHLESARPWGGLGIAIDGEYVKRLVREHMAGTRDHAQRLYVLLVLSVWARSVGSG